MYIPEWVLPLLSQRETDIINCPNVWCSSLNDPFKNIEGIPSHELEWLVSHQQHIIAGNGDYFTIDSKLKQIIS